MWSHGFPHQAVYKKVGKRGGGVRIQMEARERHKNKLISRGRLPEFAYKHNVNININIHGKGLSLCPNSYSLLTVDLQYP